MLRRQLEQIAANPAEIREMVFMDMIRTGAEAGLVQQVSKYRVYREKRNMTSSAYDLAKAEEVLAVLDDFLTEMFFLRDELKSRNADAYSWEVYSTTRTVTLTSGPGTKFIYIQFRNGLGNISTTYLDDIIYVP